MEGLSSKISGVEIRESDTSLNLALSLAEEKIRTGQIDAQEMIRIQMIKIQLEEEVIEARKLRGEQAYIERTIEIGRKYGNDLSQKVVGLSQNPETRKQFAENLANQIQEFNTLENLILVEDERSVGTFKDLEILVTKRNVQISPELTNINPNLIQQPYKPQIRFTDIKVESAETPEQEFTTNRKGLSAERKDELGNIVTDNLAELRNGTLGDNISQERTIALANEARIAQTELVIDDFSQKNGKLYDTYEDKLSTLQNLDANASEKEIAVAKADVTRAQVDIIMAGNVANKEAEARTIEDIKNTIKDPEMQKLAIDAFSGKEVDLANVNMKNLTDEQRTAFAQLEKMENSLIEQMDRYIQDPRLSIEQYAILQNLQKNINNELYQTRQDILATT